jgi:hypothetical protein
VSDSENLKYVLEQQEKRLTVLKFIWERTRHEIINGLNPDELCEELGLSEEDFTIVLKYLYDEQLVTAIIISNLNGWDCGDIKISHSGKLEMEAAITNPNQDTEHFFSTVIIMNQTNIHAGGNAIGNIIGSKINAPVTNTIQATDADFILQAIANLKQQIDILPQERQSIASEAISNIEEAVSNPTLLEKAKSSLWTLWGVTQGVVGFANAVTAIAQRFGIDFSPKL